jgi:hypothetical protein
VPPRWPRIGRGRYPVLLQGLLVSGAHEIRHFEETAAAQIAPRADDRAAIDAAMPPEAVTGPRDTEAALALVDG